MTAPIGSSSGTGQTSPVQSSEIDFGSVGLSPDLLVSFLRTKLENIDGQVRGMMDSQNARAKTTEAINHLSSLLSSYPGGIVATDEVGKTLVRDAYQDAINKAGPDTQTGRDLQAQLDAFNRTSGKDGQKASDNDLPDVSGGEMTKFGTDLGPILDSVNRNNELEMMKLQQLVSQRQTAIQSCTNMLSSMNQSTMAVVQNVGK